MMKDVRSYLALLTSLIVASLISFALGVTSTLWYLQPVLPGGPMTVASAAPEQGLSSVLPPPPKKTTGVPPAKTASATTRPSPQRLNTLLPSEGANVPDGGDGSAKMVNSSDHVAGAAPEPMGSAADVPSPAAPATPSNSQQRPLAEVATASSSPSTSPSQPAPSTVLPAASQSAEGAAQHAAPAPSPQQSAPAEKPTQIASSSDQAAGPPPESRTGRGPVFQLQLGAFLNAGNANRFKKDLNMQGFAVKISPKKDRQGRVWQVARLGAYSDRLTAVEAAARFRRDTGLDAIVMQRTPINQG